MNFVPKLEVLPPAQRALWPKLRGIPRNFVLYGGTALALRFGHRTSIDFDFFASAPIDPDRLLKSLELLKGAKVRDVALNTLSVDAGLPEPVKLSFFGLNIGRVANPELSADGVVQIASALDVAGCKLAVIQVRAEIKDYLDIYELLRNGISIPEALGAGQAIYGEQFSAITALKALASYRDGELKTLPDEIRRSLSEAASAVDEIPEMKRLPGGLVPFH